MPRELEKRYREVTKTGTRENVRRAPDERESVRSKTTSVTTERDDYIRLLLLLFFFYLSAGTAKGSSRKEDGIS